MGTFNVYLFYRIYSFIGCHFIDAKRSETYNVNVVAKSLVGIPRQKLFKFLLIQSTNLM